MFVSVVCWCCSQKPIKFVERSRAGTQMLCLSFSPGELFNEFNDLSGEHWHMMSFNMYIPWTVYWGYVQRQSCCQYCNTIGNSLSESHGPLGVLFLFQSLRPDTSRNWITTDMGLAWCTCWPPSSQWFWLYSLLPWYCYVKSSDQESNQQHLLAQWVCPDCFKTSALYKFLTQPLHSHATVLSVHSW